MEGYDSVVAAGARHPSNILLLVIVEVDDEARLRDPAATQRIRAFLSKIDDGSRRVDEDDLPLHEGVGNGVQERAMARYGRRPIFPGGGTGGAEPANVLRRLVERR